MSGDGYSCLTFFGEQEKVTDTAVELENLKLENLPVKGPDMVRGLSAGKQDYIVTSK